MKLIAAFTHLFWAVPQPESGDGEQQQGDAHHYRINQFDIAAGSQIIIENRTVMNVLDHIRTPFTNV